MANKRNAPSGPEPDEGPSFEQALERLETIVHELEGGELTLDQSLARFEEGTRLSQRLTRVLDEAESRIERLSQEGEPAATTPMDLDLESKARGPSNGEGELPF
jgi:exodeoxyribonuclease VII small subunit